MSRAAELHSLVVPLVLGFAVAGLTACRTSDGSATAVGTLEMVEVDVGPLQVARAVRVLVAEGDRVRAGETLAVFSTPTLTANVAQAEARAAAAAQAAAELTRGARPAEIARAQKELDVADADAVRAAADLVRLEPLAQRGDISRASLDAARAAARATVRPPRCRACSAAAHSRWRAAGTSRRGGGRGAWRTGRGGRMARDGERSGARRPR
ncbi:MAG: biotin/lipoyl-binding protein [Gemmatimonas sp.]|nr:biotin/lipoyl-binding protein [Gemmatimonas sp.]